MQNNKIVLTSNIIWGFAFFRIGLIRTLISEGYEVICIAEYDNFSENSVAILNNVGAKCIHLPLSRKGKNVYSDIVYFFKLFSILKHQKPALIINYSIKPIVYGAIVSKILKIPSFSVFPGLGQGFMTKNFINKVLINTYKFCLRFNKKVFLINKDDVAVFIQNKIINENKIVYLPSEGVDTSYFSPIPISLSDKIVFLFIARLFKEKGIIEFVESAKIITQKYLNVEFQVLGFLDLENENAIQLIELEDWEKNGYIKYLGKTDDVKSIIAKSSCVVLPSYYREGVPRSLLEAASMAKPLITTNHLGCKELVDDSITGYLVEPRNVNDLVSKMEIFINLSVLERTEMGKKGREKIISEFDETIVNAIYLQEIRKIVQ